MGRPVGETREGTRLGSYEIVRRLARGGMAELFLAQTVGPEGFAKLVVLKKILPNYAENPKFVRLFLDEAKLVAQMDHPHIAHVYDMGKEDGDYFFAMEYVHGQDLRGIWRRTQRTQRSMPIAHVLQIVASIASALHYAHERTDTAGDLLGIVHRDVSPSNILLSYDGAVKLVDFGVAKAATSTVKTRTGTLKGKISYMSPEQAKGAGIDRRSDVFSLGIVLWELLTGRRLYKAENDLATIQMIINSKPQPPSQLRADCPRELDAIIARALSTNLDARYQSAWDMQHELATLAHEQRHDTSPAALRVYMQELFEEELRVWNDALASGQTLIDHVAAQPTLILPISDSDLSDDDAYDDEPEDSNVESDAIAFPPTVSGLPPTRRSVPYFDDDAVPTEQLAALPTTNPVEPIAATIQRSVPPPPRPSAPGVLPAPSAFPVAPAAWRLATAPAAVVDDSRAIRIQHVLIGCSVTLALVVLLVLALAGNSDRRAGIAPASVEPVRMRVVPQP